MKTNTTALENYYPPLTLSFDAAQKTLNKALEGMIKYYDLQKRMDLTHDDNLCNTFEKVCSYYENNFGKLLIWRGGSDNTVFGKPHLNWYFRAWHDLVHVKYNKDFTPKGEAGTCAIQQNQLRKAFREGALRAQGFRPDNKTHEKLIDLCCKMLHTEIIGQNEYYQEHGEFVSDQVGFTKSYMKKTFNIELV